MKHTRLVWFVLSFCSVAALAIPGDEWRYSDITSLIDQRASQGHPLQSPDELIEALPAGLKSHFTFVYKTQNKFQAADPLHPRALAFNANLVYAFNGHPSQKGYSTIELMELDEAGKKLNLREIEFTKGPRGPEVHYSTSNPPKCLQCHGANPRPIWAEYSTWPGLYGSSDDTLSGEELENYKHFLANLKTEPNNRYAKLIYPTGTTLPPYKEQYNGDFAYRINLVLTKLLTRFNGVRLTGMVEASPYYQTLKWLVPLTGYTYGCGNDSDIDDKLKAELAPILKAKGVKQSNGSPFEQLMLAFDIPVVRFNMAPGKTDYGYGDGSGDQQHVFLDNVTLQIGKDDPGLAKTYKVDYHYHQDRYSSYALYARIDELDGRITFENCDYLKSKARDAVAQTLPPPEEQPARSFEQLLQRAEETRANAAIPISCVYCHTVQESEAPRISFGDEKVLTGELNADSRRLYQRVLERSNPHAAANLQMPPPTSAAVFNPLSDQEYQDFQNYLKQLIGG